MNVIGYKNKSYPWFREHWERPQNSCKANGREIRRSTKKIRNRTLLRSERIVRAAKEIEESSRNGSRERAVDMEGERDIGSRDRRRRRRREREREREESCWYGRKRDGERERERERERGNRDDTKERESQWRPKVSRERKDKKEVGERGGGVTKWKSKQTCRNWKFFTVFIWLHLFSRLLVFNLEDFTVKKKKKKKSTFDHVTIFFDYLQNGGKNAPINIF